MAVLFRLREVLEEAGLGQSEVSRRSGVSFATVNRMCTNATRNVSLDVLDKLCATLGVEPGAIVVLEREAKRGRGK